MGKYKEDDWVRLKGQSARECVHIVGTRTVSCSGGTQFWYEGRLLVFDSYNQRGSHSLFIFNEIEVAEKIKEPKPK